MKPPVVATMALGIALASGASARCATVPPPVVTRAGGVTIVEQNDPAQRLVGAAFFLQAGLDRQAPDQSGLAALVAQAIVDTPVSAPGQGLEPLRDAIADGGGSIAYNVDGGDVRFYLEGMHDAYLRSLLPMFRTALSSPDLSARALASARARLNRKIAGAQRSALDVGVQMLNRAFYQSSDAGLPPYGDPASLANFQSSDARRFYATYYRRDATVVSAVGDLSGISAADLATAVAGLPAGATSPIAISTPKLEGTSRQLETHRDIPVEWLLAQFPAPSLDSPDFGPMLILTSFLDRTLGEIAQAPTVATPTFEQRGTGVLYDFSARPANVILYVDGGLGDPTRTLATALTLVSFMSAAKIEGDLGDMKAVAAGGFVSSAMTLEDRAWLAGVFAMRNGSPDYLRRAMAAIDATTPAALQRVARRYFRTPTVAIVLPREGVQ